MRRFQIAPGVHLSYDAAQKFNRCRISIHFAFPARRETATAHALLPLVMERGYADCPDMTQMTKKLARLYGADLTVDARPMGCSHNLCVSITGIKDQFALEGEKLTQEYAALALGTAFHPYFVGSTFDPEAVGIEKQMLKKALEDEVNDKRLYCQRQANREFFGDSPAGVRQEGYLEEVDGLTPEKTEAFLQRLNDVGHASPIEHASFTFGIEGVSRTFLAQVTRHRIGSFSVQSQRYVRLEDFRYVIPPEIEAIPEAKAAFIESMNEDARRYLDLVQKLEDGHTARLMAEGLPEKQARAKASKQANEDARFVLPNACETKMVVTMNARSLQNFFHLRCCSRAQWEIRQLAEEMLRLVYPVAPHIFRTAGPACVSGPCPEGKMCCGKTAEVRAKYAAIKEGAAV